MKIEGQPFQNSRTCEGISYAAEGAPLDLAEITVDGRYPERGWVCNKESHEMVRILRGVGQLALKNGDVTYLEKGDSIHVPAGEWFAWSGDMTMLMACSPSFSKEQYEVEEV